jgi:hypothetical protein
MEEAPFIRCSRKITKFKFIVIYFNQDRRKPVNNKFKKEQKTQKRKEI